MKLRFASLMIAIFAHNFLLAQSTASCTTTKKVKKNNQMQKTSVITPPAGPIVTGGFDVFLDAEFLYMYAKSTNMDWATRSSVILENSAVVPEDTIAVPTSFINFGTHWDPAGRIGIGAILDHDGWDLFARWFFFYNRKNSGISVLPFSLLDIEGSPGGTPGTSFINVGQFHFTEDFVAESANAFWTFLVNSIDLEMGRNFFVSKWLSLRPYGAIRGAWTNHRMRIKSAFNDNLQIGVGIQNRIRYSQDFWGIGILAGIENTWFFAREWAIWGDIDGALLYGRYGTQRNQRDLTTDSGGIIARNIRFNTAANSYGAQPIFEFSIGLRWQRLFNEDRLRFLIAVGWEQHVWLNQIAFYKFLSDTVAGDGRQAILRTQGDISYAGGIVRARIDF